MVDISVKTNSGLFDTIKLIDAFKVLERNIVFALIYKGENDNNLMKIYISKYENETLKNITDDEWSIAKEAMTNIVTGKKEYEIVKLPNVLSSENNLKPCLIANVDAFVKHYQSYGEVVDNNNYKFSDGDKTWNNEKESKEENDDSYKTVSYKTQKSQMLNIVSNSIDKMFENKNKEIIELQETIERLDRELRKEKLEKKKAMDIIDMYHDKITKLGKIVSDNKEA